MVCNTPASIGIPSAASSAAVSTILPYTSPAHIQAVAWLHGVKCAEPEKARVLELGCLAGENLLPFALAYPQSSSIGIDLDVEKIEEGQQLLSELGVENLQLAATDLNTLLESDLGQFDYIIVHGIFGLVSGEARTALLQFCQKHLSPIGTISFKYATYPGGKMAEVLKDALSLHTSLAETAEQQQESARAMLTYLSLGLSSNNAQEKALQKWVAQAEQQSDVQLALNYLQGLNAPCYLLDFNTLATETELTYVGDIQPHTELAEHYGDNVSSMHQAICASAHKVLKQQYLDFAVGRESRFSLLVAQARAGEVLPEPDWSRLADFHWAGSFLPFYTDKGISTNGWRSASGVMVTTSHPLTQRVLTTLGESWPLAQSFQQLLFNTREPEKTDTDEKTNLQNALKALFSKGLSELHFRLGKCVYQNNSSPTLTLLPGALKVKTNFNFWHEPVLLDLSDTERTSLTSWDSWCNREEENYFPLMRRLHQHGVLQGKVRAWHRYFQNALLASSSVKEITSYIGALVFYVSDPESGGAYIAPLLSSGYSVKAIQISSKTVTEIANLILNSDFTRARFIAERLTQKDPENIENWNLLADTLRKTGDPEGASLALIQILARHLFSWSVYYDLATQIREAGLKREALNLARKIIRCDPENEKVWNLLAVLHLSNHNLDLAEFCGKKAIELNDNDIAVLNSMAAICEYHSRQDDANNYYRRIIELSPEASHLHSNYLFGLTHSNTVSPEKLFLEHRTFGQRTEARMVKWVSQLPVRQIDKSPGRVLRIGFVSGDLGNHPVTNFVEPAWNAIDLEHFSLYVYATSMLDDEMTNRLKERATAWHHVKNKSDVDLAQLVIEDKIDILFDLSGHTAYNRLPMFALKPAPIQITWIGYPGTTGLKAMDYRLIGYYQAKPGELDNQGTEKLIYLSAPKTKIFEPVAGSPNVNILPALENGYITFGSFNRPSKLNDTVLETWAKILVALPESKMLFGAMPNDDYQNSLGKKLQGYGVREEQLIFHGRTTMAKYLNLHHKIDIMLDSFPYTGGTTSVHAAWMGIPTLTLAGKTPASRQGVSIARTRGLDEFVVSSIDDFISRAIYWSHHRDELATIRAELRSRMEYQEGEKGNAASFLELALRKTWEIYCSGGEARSFSVLPDETIVEHQ
ncbi:methyltransferase regulatory domain-containing protein [Pectobacterium carotovorum]|uniref:O-linked N-acetylglucosamine transferase family protein n=1 Tax=Pectobacterium carotovorum TaxID=554 RepID=UPI0015DD5DA6|nr:methyltransferase regulatory domain-containing protein [Pectobacterium carotovorum]MBA0180417.1 methyltransferase regulatory domain-containing protein [Pectobacterium carotovorum]